MVGVLLWWINGDSSSLLLVTLVGCWAFTCLKAPFTGTDAVYADATADAFVAGISRILTAFCTRTRTLSVFMTMELLPYI